MDKIKNSKFKNNEEREKFLDEKFNEIQEEQEADLLIDFDKAVEESNEKPYKIKFCGKYFNVPRKMPFNFATFFFRYCYKKINGKLNVDVPEEKMFQFIQLMFGNEMIKVMEKHRKVNIDDVFDKLAVLILDKWGYGIKKKNNNNSPEKKI